MAEEKDEYTVTLEEELAQFRAEKEKIRMLLGQIGGKDAIKKEKFINGIFIIAIVILFVLDIMRHLLHIDVPLPPLFSIEIGILFVSIKIIWMMHKSTKVEHFQFWILNSIEFRINDVTRRIKKIENEIMKINKDTE